MRLTLLPQLLQRLRVLQPGHPFLRALLQLDCVHNVQVGLLPLCGSLQKLLHDSGLFHVRQCDLLSQLLQGLLHERGQPLRRLLLRPQQLLRVCYSFGLSELLLGVLAGHRGELPGGRGREQIRLRSCPDARGEDLLRGCLNAEAHPLCEAGASLREGHCRLEPQHCDFSVQLAARGDHHVSDQPRRVGEQR